MRGVNAYSAADYREHIDMSDVSVKSIQRHEWHDALLPLLPRFRHRPLAVVGGSLTSNLNKTGVRLWT